MTQPHIQESVQRRQAYAGMDTTDSNSNSQQKSWELLGQSQGAWSRGHLFGFVQHLRPQKYLNDAQTRCHAATMQFPKSMGVNTHGMLVISRNK